MEQNDAVSTKGAVVAITPGQEQTDLSDFLVEICIV